MLLKTTERVREEAEQVRGVTGPRTGEKMDQTETFVIQELAKPPTQVGDNRTRRIGLPGDSVESLTSPHDPAQSRHVLSSL